MVLLLAALTALPVCGCGGKTSYKNPEATPAQTQRDHSECDYEAAKATGNLPDTSERENRVKELFDKCLRARGYTPQ